MSGNAMENVTFRVVLEPSYWNCEKGRVNKEKENILEHIRDVTMDECKSKCVENKQCFTFDFTATGLFESSSSCGLYGPNVEIKEENPNQRIYCEFGRYFEIT